MALVTKTNVGLDLSTAQIAPQITGLIAGEDLAANDFCRIHTDGKVYRSNATAADLQARFHGVSGRDYKAGEPVTLFGPGTRLQYSTGLVVGTRLFLGATAGRLDTAATTGDAIGVAFVVSEKDIVVARYAIS
jgi:hypothetical protein